MNKFREETIGGQRLILGDCLEVLPTLETGSVDAVVTDPPYGLQIAGWDVAPPPEFAQECLRIAAGTVVMFGGAPPRSVAAFSSMNPDRMLVWAPAFSFAKTSANGMFYRFHPVWCWRLPAKQDSANADVLRNNCEGKHWWDHPATKPLGLMETVVAMTRGSILDPFMGSGTTLVAAEFLGRRGIGIEIDEGYFDIACKRVEEAVRKREQDAAQLTLEGVPA